MEIGTTKSHYEILQVSPEATAGEIEDAYNRVRVLYGEESAALYSLFSEEERKSMLKKIDEAYSALKDPVSRRRYDQESSDQPEKTSQVARAARPPHLNNEADLFGAVMPRFASFKTKLVSMDDRDPVIAEQYRVIYTKIAQVSSRDSLKSFALTSALKGEGKTSVSVNLAYILAEEFKKKVVLVECDLKKPAFSNYFRDLGDSGLVDVLTGKKDIDNATVQVKQSSLYILPAGNKIRNSSELLSSSSMRKVLAALKERYDYLIIDCPPILPLADMNILSKIVDGLILVVRAGKTPKDMVLKAAGPNSGIDYMGIILNGAENNFKDYY